MNRPIMDDTAEPAPEANWKQVWPALDTADSIMALVDETVAAASRTAFMGVEHFTTARSASRTAIEQIVRENKILAIQVAMKPSPMADCPVYCKTAVDLKESLERVELQLTAACELRRESIIQGLAMQGKLLVAEQETDVLRVLLTEARSHVETAAEAAEERGIDNGKARQCLVRIDDTLDL